MPTLLLAENNEKEATAYATQLESAGFSILKAKNASEIEQIIAEQKIEVILSDTELDNSYGDEICKKLLADSKLNNTLIIGMSTALDYSDCWINIAHEFIHKRTLGKFYELGIFILNLYARFQQNPKMRRYKENPLITHFGKSI